MLRTADFPDEVLLMQFNFPRFRRPAWLPTLISFFLIVILFAAPLRAQQPTVTAPKAPVAQEAAPQTDLTFDTLLAADSYKLYGEVRNVGALLTTGGAGEIVEPIIKLANPGPEFKSIVDFLKKNSEALASSRLMFATWPARTGIPNVFVAIEFATPDEATRFAPKLDTFLPTVLPPVPVEPEGKKEEEAKPATANQTGAEKTAATARSSPPKTSLDPKRQAATAPPLARPETRLPFMITHSGSLVFISDTTFKFEKLHPKSSALLAENHNFRVARDRFSSEPVFLFFDVELEDRTKPKPSPTPVISEEEQERIRKEQEALVQQKIEEEKPETETFDRPVVINGAESPGEATLTAPEPSPTPTPTKEQQAQMVASSQIGNMLSMFGQGEPQWPDAVGVALALDNDEYVVRAILIESQNSKRLTLPFIPQLISGPAYAVDAPSILPDDTEVFVSASIDFAQTYRELKNQAEITAKQTRLQTSAGAQASLDSFAQFERKAGFKISDDLLPVLGNELAVATPLKTMNSFGILGIPSPAPARRSSPDTAASDKQKAAEPLPIFLIAIKDRETARRLMPRVLDGLGIGAANLLAQTERREDSEIVNYAGMFSYGFIGNFLVLSDFATVRRVAEANANRQTLSSNNAFRNARHWQPRQTLGEIYVSPALMEGYQDALSKQAGTMDQAIRDFLLQLIPASSAITYALSHDGLGAVHELHLPKNLILAMVASTSAAMSATKQGSSEMNETIAISLLQMLASAEASYKTTEGAYGSIEMLAEKKLLQKDVFDKYGYRFEVVASGNGFEARATPAEYGKTGKRSLFIDQSGVVRGDDHGGGPASVADKPVQQ
jgi:hypothetical protein